MKYLTFILLIWTFTFVQASAQNLTVEGEMQLTGPALTNSADSLVIWQNGGFLGFRDASSIIDYQLLNLSVDTIHLTNGGFVQLPPEFNAGWTLASDTSSSTNAIGIGTPSSAESLQVSGAINIGNTTNPEPKAGTIRWNPLSGDFEGYNGTKWLSLTEK